MTTQEKYIAKYGKPYESDAAREKFEKEWMILLKYPKEILDAIPALGNSLYCNKDFAPVWIKFLLLLIQRGLHTEITSNDQCWCIRAIRGTINSWSSHTWAMAADLNPSDNPLGLSRLQCLEKGLKPFSEQFQQTARDAGLKCGCDFQRKDGMHWELPI